ncbi:MAG: alpha-L-glutamate ligase-like protein [Pseudomonadota bacterium]
MFLGRWRKLASRGVVGMNRRNIRYVGAYNDRRLYPLVDDKRRTKELAAAHGVATPPLLATVETQFQVRGLAAFLARQSGFAMKPARGSGGKGILVVTDTTDGVFRQGGEALPPGEVERHASNILSGLYSLGGAPDVAVVEGLVDCDPVLAEWAGGGVPDIRVVVFRGYPVMAMVRLGTRASGGKANLHQGAVGVGLDLATGRAVQGVQFDRPCRQHPDSGADFAHLAVPGWDALLAEAAACYDMTGLGYLGVDLVLDRDHGPLLLELNARPGLAIQMTNGEGLRPRLDRVEAEPEGRPAAERAAWAQAAFPRIPL